MELLAIVFRYSYISVFDYWRDVKGYYIEEEYSLFALWDSPFKGIESLNIIWVMPVAFVILYPLVRKCERYDKDGNLKDEYKK